MNEQDLLDLKDDIEEAKTEVNQLEGKKSSLLETLKEEWGCETLKDAKKKLKQLEKQEEKLSKKLKDGIAELEETYELE